ncbi:MAG: 4-hydroxy-tetrahydrodipicolinate reductase [Halobacteria archaeon]
MTVDIAVVGADGRMGTLVAEVVSERQDSALVGAVDVDGDEVEGVEIVPPGEAESVFVDADVVVDFSVPKATERAVEAAIETDTAVVTGTTGHPPVVQGEIEEAADHVSVLQSSNFARGVNVFWEAVEEAASHLQDYDFEVTETHHRHKTDAPSGTAKTAVERIEDAVGEKEKRHGREGNAPRSDEIGVHARRGGGIVGEHEVLMAGDEESIRIEHRAGERKAFAAGAVDAAEWIAGRSEGWYNFGDVLGIE